MTEETNDPTIRSQADEDDARLAERMKSIMSPKPARATKGRSTSEAPAGNPGWMKSKPKAKPVEDKAAKPARPAKRKTSTVRPPKNSEESWKLAAEHIARQDAGE